MSEATRSSQHVWLIGFPNDIIPGAKLPNGRDVMHFVIQYREQRSSIIGDSAHATYRELFKIWERCGIPVVQGCH